MDRHAEQDSKLAAARSYRLLLLALNNLPDRSVMDVAALADRIGADKLELIKWMRADIELARLIASKVTNNPG